MSRRIFRHLDYIVDNGFDPASRVLFIDREIESYDDTILRRLHALEAASTDPITVIINSPGGDVYTGLAIYDALRDSPCTITTKGAGLIASMASIVFLAGKERILLPQARYMVHSIQTIVGGSSKDLYKEAEEIKVLEDTMLTIYAERTKRKKDFWKKCDRSTYFSAKECVDMGVATEIAVYPEER